MKWPRWIRRNCIAFYVYWRLWQRVARTQRETIELQKGTVADLEELVRLEKDLTMLAQNRCAKLEAELCWEKREHEKTVARLYVMQAKEDARERARGR